MKTIIAGSRTCTDYNTLLNAVRKINWKITAILSGNANGADKLGIRYAKEHDIPFLLYNAEWDKYGKKAGIVRNLEMIKVADALIALWDGRSSGTKHVIYEAIRCEMLVHIENFM